MKETIHTHEPGLCGDNLNLQHVLSEVFLTNHLASTDNKAERSRYRIYKTEDHYNSTVKHAEKKPRIREDSRNSHSTNLLNQRRPPNSASPQQIQKQCTTSRSSWGHPSLSLTTKGSWLHLGGAKSLVAPLMPMPSKTVSKHKAYLRLINLVSMRWNQFCPVFHYCKVWSCVASFRWNLWW